MAIRYKIQKINNKRFPAEKPCHKIILLAGNKITTEDIADKMEEDSSFTSGDVTGIFKNLIFVLTQHLSRGDTVTLDGIGTFFLSAELKDKTMDPEKIDGKDIRLKKICFKPDRTFKRKIENEVKFHKPNTRRKG